MSSLKIIVPENSINLGERINKCLNDIKIEEAIKEYGKDYVLANLDLFYEDYLIRMSNKELIRFNNGEGKAVIRESVRNTDLYILSDVSNNSITYKLRGVEHQMGPDEHFMDILRILSAECGHGAKRTLIMPYLYNSRQDRKDSRESLDCAVALKILLEMGINEIVTCDVHNKGVMNAVPTIPFENMYLTDTMLEAWLIRENIKDKEDIICISPDEGAMKRARFFSEVLDDAKIGSFYKYRSQDITDGSAQIREHRFLGNEDDLIGRTALVTDDMIDSGSSILDTAKQLKELGAERVYLMTTFAFFSKGIEKFNEYYECGYFDKVYSTNLVYVSPEIRNQPWFETVDCSHNIANIINELHHGRSIGELIKGRDDVLRKVRKIREERGKTKDEIE